MDADRPQDAETHGAGNTTAPAPISARTARRLLASAWRGDTEILGILEGSPLLVVNVEAGEDFAEPVPPWVPCVVVGVSRGQPEHPAPSGADVALCPGDVATIPSGWVCVARPEEELQALADQIGRWPTPAVVLAQVLRAGADLDVESGLLMESLAYSTLQAGSAFGSWLAHSRHRSTRPGLEPEEPVLVDRSEERLTVTLNRPHVRNAVDVRLRDALADALAMACADPSIAEIEIRGAGPDFCSGGDLRTFGTLPDPATAHVVRTTRSPPRLLWRIADHLTVYLHGAAVGAGIELAAVARRVIATPDARCQLPEITLGLLPGAGGTVSIPRRIGRHRTAWLAISGAFIDADTAFQWGLVDEVGGT
jgi:hypothetical protein